MWGVIDFGDTGIPLLLNGNTEAGLVNALLWSASLVLLLNGGRTLSVDGLIAKGLKV